MKLDGVNEITQIRMIILENREMGRTTTTKVKIGRQGHFRDIIIIVLRKLKITMGEKEMVTVGILGGNRISLIITGAIH